MVKNLFNNLVVILLAGIFFFFINSSSPANELTFAQISDAHYSPDKINTSYRLNSESSELLKDAISQVNENSAVSFTVFTGDMINKSRKEDLFDFIKIANTLNKPWYAAFGNHDISIGGFLSKQRYLGILKQNNNSMKSFQKPYYSFIPKKGYKVIILDTIVDTKITANGEISKKQLEWFDEELAKSQNDIVLVFMHVPIIEPFESPSHSLLDSKDALSLLEKYKNPIAIFSGHYHTTKIIPMGNLLFVSTPSLVSYPNAFRIVKVINNKDEVIFDIQFKETGLQDVQKLSKMMVFSSSLYYGEDNDRNFVYKVAKRNMENK